MCLIPSRILNSDSWVEAWHMALWIYRGVCKSVFTFPCKSKTADLLFSLCTWNSEGQAQGAWALELILSDKSLFSVVYGKSSTIKPLDTAWDLHLIMFDRFPLAIFINEGCLARTASRASNKQHKQVGVFTQWFCAVLLSGNLINKAWIVWQKCFYLFFLPNIIFFNYSSQ